MVPLEGELNEFLPFYKKPDATLKSDIWSKMLLSRADVSLEKHRRTKCHINVPTLTFSPVKSAVAGWGMSETGFVTAACQRLLTSEMHRLSLRLSADGGHLVCFFKLRVPAGTTRQLSVQKSSRGN